MAHAPPPEEGREDPPTTLGDLLFAKNPQRPVSEREWAALVRAIAEGDELALHALYSRTYRIVFTLMVKIVRSRETAEELTLDVFHDVWRRASGYDPANGSVVGWIMNQARSRAIDRLRFEQRKKRVASPNDVAREPGSDRDPLDDPHDVIAAKQRSRFVRQALDGLAPGERQAIETAFFSELTYEEVATRLDQPVGTVKTHILRAKQKLRSRLAAWAEA